MINECDNHLFKGIVAYIVVISLTGRQDTDGEGLFFCGRANGAFLGLACNVVVEFLLYVDESLVIEGLPESLLSFPFHARFEWGRAQVEQGLLTTVVCA